MERLIQGLGSRRRAVDCGGSQSVTLVGWEVEFVRLARGYVSCVIWVWELCHKAVGIGVCLLVRGII
jgi:hypothetical protein